LRAQVEDQKQRAFAGEETLRVDRVAREDAAAAAAQEATRLAAHTLEEMTALVTQLASEREEHRADGQRMRDAEEALLTVHRAEIRRTEAELVELEVNPEPSILSPRPYIIPLIVNPENLNP